MTKTPQDRVRDLLYRWRLTPDELSNQCEMDPGSLSRWLSGERKGFSAPVAHRLAALTGIAFSLLHSDARAK